MEMELGLSLGDASKPFDFLKNNPLKREQQKKNGGVDFCMALGLNSSVVDQKADEDEEEDEDDDDDDEVSEGDEGDSNNQDQNRPLQLNLLPPRISSHLHSFPWSSDNGSWENGSSGNMAAKGRAAAVEEASSGNSEMEYNKMRGVGNEVVASDDDDENGVNNRKKLRLSKQQSAFLEQSFKLHNTLNPKQKLGLAKQLNLRPRQVEVWFQNRRARTKSKQTEVDCEYLKRYCETLTEENRRLHQELQDLRALKTSNPFYMQLPATTLTMCPSCQRVATSSAASAPFPQNRPRFFPFSQTPAHHDQPAAI